MKKKRKNGENLALHTVYSHLYTHKIVLSIQIGPKEQSKALAHTVLWSSLRVLLVRKINHPGHTTHCVHTQFWNRTCSFLCFRTFQFIWHIRCFHCFLLFFSFNCSQVFNAYLFAIASERTRSSHQTFEGLTYSTDLFSSFWILARLYEHRTPIGVQCLRIHSKYQTVIIHVDGGSGGGDDGGVVVATVRRRKYRSILLIWEMIKKNVNRLWVLSSSRHKISLSESQ